MIDPEIGPSERRELLFQMLMASVPAVGAAILQDVEEGLCRECIEVAVREIGIETERYDLVRSLREVGTARAVDSIINEVVNSQAAAVVRDFLKELGDTFVIEKEATSLCDMHLNEICAHLCTDAIADTILNDCLLQAIIIDLVQSILHPSLTLLSSDHAKSRQKPLFSTSRELVGDCQHTLDLLALRHMANMISTGTAPVLVHRSLDQLITAAAVARLDAILRLVATPRIRIEQEPLFAEISLAICTEKTIETLLPDLDAALTDHEAQSQRLEDELYGRTAGCKN